MHISHLIQSNWIFNWRKQSHFTHTKWLSLKTNSHYCIAWCYRLAKLNWPSEHICFYIVLHFAAARIGNKFITRWCPGRRWFSHRTMNERARHWIWQSPKPHWWQTPVYDLSLFSPSHGIHKLSITVSQHQTRAENSWGKKTSLVHHQLDSERIN